MSRLSLRVHLSALRALEAVLTSAEKHLAGLLATVGFEVLRLEAECVERHVDTPA